MRLFTDRPQLLLAASRDTYLSGLVAEDNGGPEDVVVDCMFPSAVYRLGIRLLPLLLPIFRELTTMYNAGMSTFSPHRVSRAMMRASGMRQCADHCPPTSKDEYFGAAMNYVGSITDCDLPELKEAAIGAGMEVNAVAIKTAAVNLNYDERIAHEMWMRYRVHRDFGNILGGGGGGGLQGQDIGKLKDFVFQLLYPL